MPDDEPIDVTIVLFDGGYSSTAVVPLEVFHAAGLLWNRLHGEQERPRFRVRSATVDGRPVTSTYGLGLTPQCAIDEVRHTDLILLTHSVQEGKMNDVIAQMQALPTVLAPITRIRKEELA